MTAEPGKPQPLVVEDEIARLQAIIREPGKRGGRPRQGRISGIRPRNAASLILLDRTPRGARILMGKRNRNLKFMPGALVFPGGSVDRSDGAIPAAEELPTATAAKIVGNLRGRPSERAGRALGMAAIREVAEESGILIGRPGRPPIAHDDWTAFVDHSVTPSLSGFSLLARAITPPGPPRRFDTWFFVAEADTIGHIPADGFHPCGELEGLEWIAPERAIRADTREITRVILVELINRMSADPRLDPEYPVPFYRSLRNRFHRSLI